jgi:hypothetical protein
MVSAEPGAAREVPEQEATGKIKSIYDDLKSSMRVPIVDSSFRLLAGYPYFFETAWQQLKPNVLTVYFEERADDLRSRAVEGTARLGAPPRPGADASDVLKVFHYLDSKLLLAMLSMRGAVGGQYPLLQTLSSAQKRQIPPGIPANAPEIQEVDSDGADDHIRAIFDDVRRVDLGLVKSDYRALAKWPDYLGWAWQSLKPVMGSGEYASLRRALRRTAEAALVALPFRLELSPHTLRSCGLAEADIDAVRSTLDRLCAVLSGTVANVAYLSIGADGDYGASRSPFPLA